MGAIGRVQARGQVTLPREIRPATGIRAGAELIFLSLGPGRFEAHLVPPRRTVRELLDAFATDGPVPGTGAMAAAVEEGLVDEAATRQHGGGALDA